jgi:ATP-dependent HslUV protease subunit HslV
MISGGGDVMGAEGGIIGIGSGGFYATAAARALWTVEPALELEDIARRSMKVAADLCVYTNENFTVEKTEAKEEEDDTKKQGDSTDGSTQE